MTLGARGRKQGDVAWTGVGSLPFDAVDEAVHHVLESYPHAPYVPEIASVGGGADMIRSALPVELALAPGGYGARALSPGPELASSRVFEPTPAALDATSLLRAHHAAADAFARQGMPDSLAFHMAGPLTLLHVVRDAWSQPLSLYPEMRAAVFRWCEALALRVASFWRDRVARPIFFLDEPVLGLAGIDLDAEDLASGERRIIDAIRAMGIRSGLHCCAPPPIPWLCATGVDEVSIDAVRYGETILEHAGVVEAFLEGGGTLVLGVIPVLPDGDDLSPTLLLVEIARRFEKLGFEELVNRLVLSPSCGTVLAPRDREQMIARKLGEFSGEIGRLRDQERVDR